jgi:hypothetical protein
MTTTHAPIIIEHPTRGVLRPDSVPGNQEWHWSWSGARNDPEKSWIFTDILRAREVFQLLPPNVRKNAAIRQYLPDEAKKINRLMDPYLVVT